MHGVSTVIVIILILMITVALSALAYTFFSRILTGVTTAGKEAVEQATTATTSLMKIEAISADNIYIRNIGQSDLTGFSIYLNDNPINFDAPSVVGKGEVGVINTSLCPGEVRVTTTEGAIATKRFSDDSIVLCLKFDESSGTIAKDSSGKGNDGRLYNGTALSCYGGDCPNWVGGKFGNALSLDGINDFINATVTGINTASGGYNTVTFWMNWKGYTSQMPITIGNPYDLWIQSATCMGFNTGAGDAYGINSSLAGFSNRWVRVALVFFNGAYTGNNKIYMDGVPQTLAACVPSAGSKNADTTIYVGSYRPPAYFFNGTIDEVKIYNRAIY